MLSTHFGLSPPTVAGEILLSLAAYLVFSRFPPAELYPLPPGAAIAAAAPMSSEPKAVAATAIRALRHLPVI
ncbi:hypothetical protein FHX52_1501 [Humibacillus xanthopallidus]|uniref:Uncharacterized protein n=1 Tax=Humibacillus xanthopallidus TaxID=412689 RepID=A0A543PWG1_9MICO|nr:hypothetical protein [Humibacillus xanthopallidus]TQN48370.1 hypothetical protein FHX52_1501 [Humibacillus xanthopallidus]